MLPKFLNAPDYMTLLNQLADQDGQVEPFTQTQIDRTRSHYDPDLYPDVNWIDAITKDYAYTTRGNLDISGGSDFLRYSIVASYFRETGILEQDKTLAVDNSTNNQQFYLHSNIDMDVTKTTLLRVNIGGYLNRFRKQRVNTDGAFSNAFATLPFVYPARYSDGSIPVAASRSNPWAEVTQGGYDLTTSSKIETLFSVEQNLKFITPGSRQRVSLVSTDGTVARVDVLPTPSVSIPPRAVMPRAILSTMLPALVTSRWAATTAATMETAAYTSKPT